MATAQLIVSEKGILLPLTGRRQRRNGVVIGYSLVADDDFTRDELLIHRWHKDSNGYGSRSPHKHQMIKLHHVVFIHYHGPVPIGLEIDHIDRDSLNNLPDNLRAVTRSQNVFNSGRRRNNTSGFRGVSWHKEHRKWNANVRVLGKLRSLGDFPSAREAADAVNIAWALHHPHLPVPNP